MRLGGRIQAAIEILADVEARKRPASEALKDWGLAHRFAGGSDRSAIGNLVYDSLRKKASQAWSMGSDAPIHAVFATLLGQWGLDADALAAAFDGDRFAPQMPDAAVMTHYGINDLKNAPDCIQADIPQWCASHFENAFGAEWVGEAAALSMRPPLDLRVNRLKATPEKLMRQLDRVKAIPGPLSEDAIRIEAGFRDTRLPNVQAEPAYQKGWFEVQDCGSQAAALLVGAQPGEQILDFCAGAGGKTLALASRMENRGQLHAHDSDRNRLAPIFDRLKRAGTRNVQVHARASELEPLAGKMDCVLVDAPCTGTGTWRRRPDAKWRFDEKNLAARIAEQDKILEAASRYVKPGGRLVYVTCSLLPQENVDRIVNFLHANSGFAPSQLPVGSLCNTSHLVFADPTKVTLTPLGARTDGFFIAAMSRKTGT